MMKVTVQDSRFVDENGGQVLFNGINYVCKEP